MYLSPFLFHDYDVYYEMETDMGKRAQQIYSKTTDLTLIEGLLIEYVRTYANSFNQCSVVRLQGVEQVLLSLIRKKREFYIYTQSGWTVIWEVVDYTDFADPSIAKYLSEKTGVESIWVKLDVDYNIWAYQIFEGGVAISEAFLPEEYFAGDPESAKRYSYGNGHKLAILFGDFWDLPLFLTSLNTVERDRDLVTMLRKVTCKLPTFKGKKRG